MSATPVSRGRPRAVVHPVAEPKAEARPPPKKKRKTSAATKNAATTATTPEVARKKKAKDPCKAPGCPKSRSGKCAGYCATHYKAFLSSNEKGHPTVASSLPSASSPSSVASTAQPRWLKKRPVKDLDYAEKMGLPPGWSCRENLNANYLIYSPGREERFTSKAKAFAAAGVEMPPINRNQPTSASAKKKKRKREEEVEEVSEEEEEESDEEEEEEGDDPPWRPSGHKFIGQTVKVVDDEGSEQLGTIVGWIADTDVDKDGNPGFVSEETGKPACLFNVEFGDGTSQDFEEEELQGKFVPASEISAPAAKKPKGKSKGARKSCAVPGCPKNARGPSYDQMCIAHYRQCRTLHCGPEDLASGTISNTANGDVDNAGALSQDHIANAGAIPFPDDFDSMAAAAAASAADGGLPNHEPADIIPRELEATAVEATEEDFHAILEALEPSRHATRSGRDFTSPLFGQL